MDKYRSCPSIIAMFTSDSQHPPRSRHAVYLGDIVMLFITIHTKTGRFYYLFNHFSSGLEKLELGSLSFHPKIIKKKYIKMFAE